MKAITSIVLVDDEEDVLTSLERDLREWTRRHHLTVYTVGSAEECLRLVQEEYPAVGLVISDLRMPGMSGADLFVRLHDSYPDIGCIMVTAYSDMEEITRAVSTSMLGLLQKPWDPIRLAENLDRGLAHVQHQRHSEERSRELTQQLELAGAFQRSSLAISMPDDPRIDFGFLSRPAREMHVSGDFNDLLQLDDERYLIIVGDVAGHGVRAALLSAMLMIALRTYMARVDGGLPGPAALLDMFRTHLHEYLPRDSGMIVSCAVAVVHVADRTVTVANAGHPPVYVISKGEYRYSSVLDPALGMDSDGPYTEETLSLDRGERLVMFTDGLYASNDGSIHEFSATKIGAIFQGAHRSIQFEDNVIRLLTADRILHGKSTVPLFNDDLTLASLRIR